MFWKIRQEGTTNFKITQTPQMLADVYGPRLTGPTLKAAGANTWHTNLDTYERIVEDDVEASAIASRTWAARHSDGISVRSGGRRRE